LEEISQNDNVQSDVAMGTHTEADNNSESTQHNDDAYEGENKEINDEVSEYITDTDNDNDADVPQTIPAVLMFHDVGYLEFDKVSKLSIVSQQLRTEMITRGPHIFQNKDVQFAVSGGRSITQQWFKRRLASGDEVNRSWLLYSPVNESAYCFCCLLFTSSTSNCQSSFESANGFNNWRHTERVKDHENSSSHRKSFTTWKETERRILHGKGIDAEVEAQIQS
jgi:ribonuclease HII